MTNSVYTRFGGLSLPVSDADVADGLALLDPARDTMLAWFTAAINAEFSSAWTAATSSLPSSHKLLGTLPVQDTLPGQPTRRTMQERKAGFPLLALHRTGTATFESSLLEEDILTQDWHLHHILGPLDIEGERRILDIGQAVGKLLAASIRAHGHPAYQSGANQFEESSLKSLVIRNITGPGPASFNDEDDSVFWSTLYTLTTTEISTSLTKQMSEFDGADLSVDVGGPEILPDFVEAQW